MLNSTKTRPVIAELFHMTDGRTDRYDEVNGRFV
jgi:hypothetical protein